MRAPDDPKVLIAKQALLDFLKTHLTADELGKASQLIATYTANCVRARFEPPRPTPVDNALAAFRSVTEELRTTMDGLRRDADR